MKPIFSRGPSLQLRLFFAVLAAIVLVIADSRLGTFVKIRTYMDTAVSPFYFLANGPRKVLDNVSETLATHQQLELENRALRQELLLKILIYSCWGNLSRKITAYVNCSALRCVRMNKNGDAGDVQWDRSL